MEVFELDIIDSFAIIIGFFAWLSTRTPARKPDKPVWKISEWYGDDHTAIKMVHHNYDKKDSNVYRNSRFAIEIGRVMHDDPNRHEKLLELTEEGRERAMEENILVARLKS